MPQSLFSLKKVNEKHVKWKHYAKEVKLKVVAQYLAVGNMKIVSDMSGVPYPQIKAWKSEAWWPEAVRELRAAELAETDTQLTKIIDKSLAVVLDRLENGDLVYDSKTGAIRRKGVNMKDAAKVTTDLLTKRELLRGNATSRTEAALVPVQDQLALLAAEFAKMVNADTTKPTVIDMGPVDILEGDVDDVIYNQAVKLEENDALHDQREAGLREGESAVQEPSGERSEAGGAEPS